jgi:hypothetical protein
LTLLEIILSMATIVLAIQILILQHHYTNKLSELTILLNDMLDVLDGGKLSPEHLDKIRLKIFNSSQ